MIVERPTLERRVTNSVDAGRIPVLLGGCGAGRTSALLRLEETIGRERAQYLNLAAAASTPERCLRAVLGAARFPAPAAADPGNARAAFDRLFAYFDAASTPAGEPVTFLLDEFLDVRTFESFPGLRHVQRDAVSYLDRSRARFVLASRFTARVHRLLRDASARFEVIHVPPVDAREVEALALRADGAGRNWASHVAPAIATLAAGRAGPVSLLLTGLIAMGPAADPVAALAAQFSPEGAITARCRECFEFRLQRARGYGALKAILGILAEAEPLNLTEIAQRLGRTPGSTKDYLSWLEDVDLVVSQGKRYSFDDPLLRLYTRLYGRPVPPTDDEIVREVGLYAKTRLLPMKALASTSDAGRAGR